MIEIGRDYKTFIKVTQLQLTRQQFYNINDNNGLICYMIQLEALNGKCL